MQLAIILYLQQIALGSILRQVIITAHFHHPGKDIIPHHPGKDIIPHLLAKTIRHHLQGIALHLLKAIRPMVQNALYLPRINNKFF
jgi:hypothetical protein